MLSALICRGVVLWRLSNSSANTCCTSLHTAQLPACKSY